MFCNLCIRATAIRNDFVQHSAVKGEHALPVTIVETKNRRSVDARDQTTQQPIGTKADRRGNNL